MKIGLLLPSTLMYERYGREKIFAPHELFLDLADGLVGRGHTVRVYSSSDTKTHATLIAGDDTLAFREPAAMKLRYVAAETKKLLARRDSRWEYELDLTAKAYKDAKGGKVDLVHSFLEFSAHYFREVTSVPTVYTLHDTAPPNDSLDYWRHKRFPDDAYVAISHSQARDFAELINVAGVVYHGLSVSRYEPNFEAGEYVLFIGRYMPEKGVEDAIRAGIETGTLTTLAGSKEYREIIYYKEHVAPYLANPLVREVGFLTGRKKAALLAGAKALLFPIQWEEPFGMVMIEAMAAGTPVVAYNRGSVPEIVRDGVTGFIVELGGAEVGRSRAGPAAPLPPTRARIPYSPSMTNSSKEEGYARAGPFRRVTRTDSSRSDFIIKKRGVEGLVEAVKRIGEIDRASCRKHVEENFTVQKMVEGYEQVYSNLLHL